MYLHFEDYINEDLMSPFLGKFAKYYQKSRPLLWQTDITDADITPVSFINDLVSQNLIGF